MPYDDFAWITPQVAVGGMIREPDALPFDAIASLETYAPLSVQPLTSQVDYRWFSILDGVAHVPHDAIVRHFEGVARQIDEWVGEGKRVLVHCYMGSSRAVTAVIWYLMRYRGYTWDEAVAYIKPLRPVADPNIRFELPLRLASGESLPPGWLEERLREYCLARHNADELQDKVRELRHDLEKQGTLA